MAFAEGDKEKIAYYLGYPTNERNLGLIQQAMDRVQAIAPVSVAMAQGAIAEIAQIEGEIEASRDGDPANMSLLVSEARKFRDRVAMVLELKINKDVF